MNNHELGYVELQELDLVEIKKIDGGFIPLIILGWTLLTATQTAAVFLTGVGIGVAVAQSHHK
jgi:hypothetical protein